MLINILLHEKSGIKKEVIMEMKSFLESRERDFDPLIKENEVSPLVKECMEYLPNGVFKKYTETLGSNENLKTFISIDNIQSNDQLDYIAITLSHFRKGDLSLFINYYPHKYDANRFINFLQSNIETFKGHHIHAKKRSACLMIKDPFTIRILLQAFAQKKILDAPCIKRLQALLPSSQ
jgi:hypothetical protein